MSNRLTKSEVTHLSSVAIIGWLAVTLQLYLIVLNRNTSVMETIVRFFGFFTILSNILVALCCTLMVMPASKLRNFFSRATTLTAICVYITIVGIVYNVILRFTWNPQGLQFVVDETLHTFIPLAFVAYWLIFVPKDGLHWRDIPYWLMYPAAYLFYTLIRGSLTGYYPYPFLDIGELGYDRVAVNTSVLILTFALFSMLFVSVGQRLSKRPLAPKRSDK